jgi:glucose/arabinose dehydrogenase
MKLAPILLSGVLLCVPTIASAQTAEDLKAMEQVHNTGTDNGKNGPHPAPPTGPLVPQTIPGGTTFQIALRNDLNAKRLNDGDTFPCYAAADVVISGVIVIPKGSGCEGHVQRVEESSSHGHSGSMRIAFDYIFASDGSKIVLLDSAATKEGAHNEAGATWANVGGFLFFGLGGLFTGNFVRGGDPYIKSGTAFNVTTAKTVTVKGEQKS